MNNKRFYVDFHVLQTVPPSCVNRDDTGSPKTAVYGGSTRARVSSQAWKQAMRKYFANNFSEDILAKRSKKLISCLAQEIQSLNTSFSPEDSEKMAKKALENAGLKTKKEKNKPEELDALFFISMAQVKALARLAADKTEDKTEYKKALKDNPNFEIILFGRMVAADPSLNYDAASQVAHSISTHAVHGEYDYFTAVDDLAPEDNAGAGHLGTVEFNSSTLYRYATVNIMELNKWLGKDTPWVVRAFADAFINSMPTGKQNTFANRTRPDAVYITLRSDQPVNFSGAFEEAILSKSGYSKPSIAKLAAYAQESYKSFVTKPILSLAVGEGLDVLCNTQSLPEVLDKLETSIHDMCNETGEEK